MLRQSTLDAICSAASYDSLESQLGHRTADAVIAVELSLAAFIGALAWIASRHPRDWRAARSRQNWIAVGEALRGSFY